MRRLREFVIPVLLLAGTAAATATVYAAKERPTRPTPLAIHVREVTPPEGKAGDVLKAHGDSLNAERVLEVYLVNDFMYKVEILEQTDHWFTFRIPVGVPAGKYRVGVVGNESPAVLEEPAFVRVIEVNVPITGE